METSRVGYDSLHHQAYELGQAIHAAMAPLDYMTDERWQELADLASLASVMQMTLSRYASRQAELDAPVPYVLADKPGELARTLRMLAGMPDCDPFPSEA